MKTRVLVFPCGSEVGLEINNALKWSTHIDLWGGSSVPDHGKFVYKNYIGSLPFIDDPIFIDRLNEIIVENKIDFVIPAHDSVVLKLAEQQNSLSCKVIGSPLETCQICRSKRKTYNKLEAYLRVPRVYRKDDLSIEYPVFLKPDVGQGSKGTHLADSRQDVEFYLLKDPSLLILEYLPGKEYTIDCFTDRHGKLRFVGPRVRNRINNGISVNTKPFPDKKFEEIAEIINGVIKFKGVWFFQLKENKKGDLALMEVAPRVAGSMGLYRNLGINFTLLSIFDASDIDIDLIMNSFSCEMDRALVNRFELDLKYKHVYIDLDDTVVFDGSVNPSVMRFLYQCFNDGIKIHLLTRHKSRFNEEVKEILEKFRIREVFDSIIDVSKDKDKSNYIKEKNSILIDDSFSERKKVSKELEIPTFEVSSLECLIR